MFLCVDTIMTHSAFSRLIPALFFQRTPHFLQRTVFLFNLKKVNSSYCPLPLFYVPLQQKHKQQLRKR